MAKKKRKRLTAAKLVKAAAREHLGTPPPTRAVPDKRRNEGARHKATLEKLLEEE